MEFSSEGPNAPAALRNADPILTVLKKTLQRDARVLEIGSGTGQHSVIFANSLPDVFWQPSDRSPNLAGIRSWTADCKNNNIGDPVELDVAGFRGPFNSYDAVFSANTTHIMNESEVLAMFSVARRSLKPAGVFLLYGPFRIDGQFTSESNLKFDNMLRSKDSAMGIRDFEWIRDAAESCEMTVERRYAMPSNNLILAMRVHETPGT